MSEPSNPIPDMMQPLRDAKPSGAGMPLPQTQARVGPPQAADTIPPSYTKTDFSPDSGSVNTAQTADGAGWMPLKLCDGSTINVWAKQ